MRIPITLEKVAGNGFQARAFGLSAHGSTPEAAVANLKELVEDAPATPGETVWVEVTLRQEQEKPWLQVKGVYENDPLFDDWQQAIAEYRRQVDEDPDVR